MERLILVANSAWSTAALHRLELRYVVAIRSNHVIRTGPGERK